MKEGAEKSKLWYCKIGLDLDDCDLDDCDLDDGDDDFGQKKILFRRCKERSYIEILVQMICNRLTDYK